MAGLLGMAQPAGLLGQGDPELLRRLLAASPTPEPASPSLLAAPVQQAQQLLQQPVQQPQQRPMLQRPRVNGARVALRTLFSGVDPFTAYDEERLRPQREAAEMARLQSETQVRQNLLSVFGGQSGGASQPSGQPQSPSANGLPAWNAVAPILAQAQLAGIDGLDGLISVLDKSRPNVEIGPDGTPYDSNDPSVLNRRFANRTNINGFVTDLNNPENEGVYRPDLAEGQEPVYNNQGRIVGVRNLDGSVQSEAARVRAVSDAQNASGTSYAGARESAVRSAAAPYQFVDVVGPNGEPMKVAASQIAGGAITGQSPVQAVIGEGNARNQVAALEDARNRSSAANRILPQLANMESLLGDINSGFGANARTTADRVAAALPLGSLNDDAQRRASATQTFQNEARQVVSGILPLFGANPTEGERNYAERMSGADVTYTPQALREGIRLARARATREQQNYNRLQAETGGRPSPSGGSSTAVVAVSGPAEAQALPSGTRFRTPDGQIRVRQ